MEVQDCQIMIAYSHVNHTAGSDCHVSSTCNISWLFGLLGRNVGLYNLTVHAHRLLYASQKIVLDSGIFLMLCVEPTVLL